MLLRIARRVVAALVSTALVLVVGAAAFYAHHLRSGPPLGPWHRVQLDDFTASDASEVSTLGAYRRLEDRLFAELLDKVYLHPDPAQRIQFNRYHEGSLSDPRNWPVDWNRTFHLQPSAAPRGGVLLLHGLTDSPYSLRSIGEHLAARGFDVVGLRLPGHGTAPSGLLSFTIEDMEAAVRLAMRDMRRRLGPAAPLYIVGYSNGAALAVDYALAVLDGAQDPRPGGLVLISPAIGVSSLAAIGWIQAGLSRIPGFGRAAWQDVMLEFDPYKYASFSFHAAGETYRLTRRIERRTRVMVKNGPIRGFPPVLAFVSTVDATVRAQAVVDALLGRLADEGHELVLYDVNRLSTVQPLMVADPGPLTARLLGLRQRSFALTVVTNAGPQTLEVEERRAAAGSDRQQVRQLGLAWPVTVFSLSHIALPFPPDDPLYGSTGQALPGHVQLGRVEVRGENGVLAVPAWLLMRQRSNPFHAYQLERIDGFLGLEPAAGEAWSLSHSRADAGPTCLECRITTTG
jgi:alpha-beta hydrolase superfamily lysophospholipase